VAEPKKPAVSGLDPHGLELGGTWDEPWQDQPLDDEPEEPVKAEAPAALVCPVCPVCELASCGHNLPYREKT
jgi:hypothetical protein